MATATVTPTRRLSRLLLGILLAIVLLVLLAGFGLGAWLYSAARSALPQLDGTLSLAGLSAPVTVVRDQHGVPHITAANLHDLFFAQGYVTAQDRLWQMDTTRRFAAGELAEILGPSLLEQDRRQRILGMRQIAEAGVATLSPELRAQYDAYAAGVNACIAAQSAHLPLEFRLLGYSPRPWTVIDSMLVGVNMSELLNLGYAGDILAREKVIAKVGPELGADLFPVSSWRDHPPTATEAPLEAPPQSSAKPSFALPSFAFQSSSFDLAAGFYLPSLQIFNLQSSIFNSPGSNNWVVSGAHTASGKPLLSNDMHLPHHIPNVWYEAHLACPACPAASGAGFDVAGVTLPGMPYVIAGHNRRIAWGFTNVNPAVLDFYAETFNPQGQYLTPDGWQAPQHRREAIHVKGRPDVVVDVVITRHGPIVSEIEPGETRKLAMKWLLYDSAALQVPFYDIDAAGNWDEFCRAFSRFGSPSQNVVYADVDGHIGYHTAGFIPLRAQGDGLIPASGADNAHEWTGYIPFDQLPSVLDPPSGIIATANGRITPDGYPHLIANEWGAAYRTQRIYRVLAANPKLTPADMLTLQTDIYSDFDRFIAQRLVYAIDNSPKASPRARQAADILRSWDGRLTADAVAPSIVARARRELSRLLLEPHLGPGSENPQNPAGWQQYRWYMSTVWLENTLLRQPPRWLPPKFSSYNDLLTAAVEAVLDRPAVPQDLRSWRWGDLSPIYLQHPLFGRFPLLDRYSGPGLLPQSGDGTTVKQVGREFGPSQRLTVDFSNLDGSTLNIVTGQSGQLFSPYYMDQWPYWYEGRTFPLPFSSDAVARSSSHQLTLQPPR